MTVSQAISNFKLYYNKKTGANAYGLRDPEIQQILEDAQLDLIGDKAFGEGFRGPGAEDNYRRVAELEYYIEPSSLTPTASADYLDYKCDLPSGNTGFMYYHRSKSKINRSDHPAATGEYFRNVFLKQEWIDEFDSYGKKVHFIEPRVTISGNRLYIKVDSFTTDVTTVRLTYIRKPKSITEMTSGDKVDVPTALNDDLIQTAVRKALASTVPLENQYKAQTLEEKKTTD